MKLKQTLSLADDIMGLCKPLFDNSVFAHLSFMRLYTSGQILLLTSGADIVEQFIEAKVSFPSISPTHQFLEPGVYYSTDLIQILMKQFDQHHVNNFIQLASSQRETFDLSHDKGLTLYTCHDGYDDMFYFSAKASAHNPYHYYLNNMDLIKHFCIYLRESLQHLLKENNSAELKLTLPSFERIEKNTDNNKSIKDQLFKHMQLDNYTVEGVSGTTNLSAREFICLLEFSKGKKTKEIACDLNISPRTVETYLSRVKTKMNCYTLSQTREVFSAKNNQLRDWLKVVI